MISQKINQSLSPSVNRYDEFHRNADCHEANGKIFSPKVSRLTINQETKVRKTYFQPSYGNPFYESLKQLPAPNVHSYQIKRLKTPKIFTKNFAKRTRDREVTKEGALFSIIENKYVFRNLRLYKPLWESQVEGINFLVQNQGALIGDEPGLGKTIQAIVAMRLLFHTDEVRRALIVVPKSTIGSKSDSVFAGSPRQWEGHLHFWAPDLSCITVTSDARSEAYKLKYGHHKWGISRRRRQLDWRGEHQVFLTTYNQIRNEIQNNAFPSDYFDLVILDEAHTIKNPYSQTSEALAKLEAKYRWGFTGTPIQNKPQDLYAIFSFLQPVEFPVLYRSVFADLNDEEFVNQTKKYFLRRTKTKDALPAKNRYQTWFYLSEEQQSCYDKRYKIRRERLSDLVGRKTEKQIKTSIFGALSDLLQICNFSPVSKVSSKVSEVQSICSHAASNGEKTIIFSRFLEFGIIELERQLKSQRQNPLILHGQMSSWERNSVLEKFKGSRNHNILLSTVFTGGVGLNLTEASTIIHFDHWWNPAVVWQAEDRAHRFGQEREVSVYSLFSRHTIEERIYKLLKKKEAMINRILSQLGNEAAEMEIESSTTVEELLTIFEL